MLRLICYMISAISFVFPPASFLFEDFKVTHCNFVLKIDSAPTWVQETSAVQVCKAPTLKALFEEASVPNVCLLKEQPKDLFVLKTYPKDLFVLKPTFPVLPVCFPVSPLLSAPTLPPSFPSLKPGLVPTGKPSALLVDGLFERLLVVSKELLLKDGYPNRCSITIFVLFLYLTLVRPRIRRHKTRCSYPYCSK
ncbi:hypothetical protein BD770DRAFT_407644 [Pilaira anomala]|nr:hypothetical protein BD770DRAFT_407644 [Pilaira anomala]